MNDAAAWIAPIATMIAAVMTAANLGVRTTGWGFVVFTAGSIAWTIVGVTTGQTNLIAANSFLTVVNLVGIWRWLGREARYQDEAQRVAAHSEAAPIPTLASATQLIGRKVVTDGGVTVGSVVDAMFDCDALAIRGLLIRHGGVGGVGERVVLVAKDKIILDRDEVRTSFDADALHRLPEDLRAVEAVA